VNVVVRFFSTPESRHVSCLIRTSKTQTRVPTEQLPKHHLIVPEVIPLLSRGHSSFRRLNCPETAPRSESFAISRLILSVPGKMNAATDFLDHRLHSRRLLHCHIISLLKCATTLIPTQTVTENRRNHSCNYEHNSDCYEKKISICKLCGYENPYDSH